jgi:hypothetical protein
MFLRAKKRGDRIYLQIAESLWVNGTVRQRILGTLGRLDILQQTGGLDALMVSMQRFSEKLSVLGVHADAKADTSRARKIGPALVFDRLWQEVGIGDVLAQRLRSRQFGFSVERAVFLTVLHRLFSPGSDRAAEKWKEDYRIEGAADLDLHHLYRAMAWLGERLPAGGQADATPLAPRCTKDEIEEELFARRRGLFTSLDLVFFDTTSIYFEGEGGESVGQYGNSKDHRPDLKQMAVGVVLDEEGNPVCSEMWPGNTTDVTTLVPVAERLKKRFGIGSVCVVADRGMISAGTIGQIESLGWHYILGARMRRCKEVNEEVLARAGRYRVVTPRGRSVKDPAPLKVKEVRVEGRRYVICANEDQAAKDGHDREAIVAALRDALKGGDRSLIGNKGYRRYVKAAGERFSVDEEKVESEARYDGKWVLRTNTDLLAGDVALKYKQLWMVEDIFRSMKSLLQTRPIFHKCDETIRGHVFCSFLALLLRKELEDRLAARCLVLEWADIIRDLDCLVEMDLEVNAKTYTVRSEAEGAATRVYQACGVALPPVLRRH